MLNERLERFVEVIYTPVSKTTIRKLVPFASGLTVADVLEHSGLMQSHPESAELSVGIFSKLVAKNTLVKPGDRVEIYRPLRCDPKEKRRQRALS